MLLNQIKQIKSEYYATIVAGSTQPHMKMSELVTIVRSANEFTQIKDRRTRSI